jgi:hypothetical protein
MILIFDTNIWIKELVLTSNLGSAVRFYIREKNARIFLPEVVKLETEYQLRARIKEFIKEINKGYRSLLAVFGELKELVLPTAEQIDDLIANVFTDLGVEINELPFTFEDAKASLLRTINKIPPSDIDHQFRDGVIWENCLNMLEDEPVYFVTNDKAFYQGRDIKKGIANKLAYEIKDAKNELKLFSSIEDLLSEIKMDVSIDIESFLELFMEHYGETIENMANKHSFVIADDQDVQLSTYITENPYLLYFTYNVEIPCADGTELDRQDGKIIAKGDGIYNTDTKNFEKISSHGERFTYTSEEGEEVKLENYVMATANIVLGHRTVKHSVRHKTDN